MGKGPGFKDNVRALVPSEATRTLARTVCISVSNPPLIVLVALVRKRLPASFSMAAILFGRSKPVSLVLFRANAGSGGFAVVDQVNIQLPANARRQGKRKRSLAWVLGINDKPV